MPTTDLHPISAAIAVLEYTGKPYSVLQIGAYVGASANDPLWPIFSSGSIQHGTLVAVEPVPEYYDELVENYAPFPNVRCLNLAVSSADGIRPIYRVGLKPTDYGQPEWLEQISSLHLERLGKLWDSFEGTDPANETAGNFARQFRCADLIQTATLKTTLKLAGINDLALLVIDAEGSEPEILPQIDFPLRFLCYEHVLLDPKPPTPDGFVSFQHGMDTFLAQADDAVFRLAYGG